MAQPLTVEWPFLPSIETFAAARRPIILPWGPTALPVGTAFSSKNSSARRGPFLPQSAFDKVALAQTQLVYEASPNGGNYHEVVTTSNSNSYEHTSVSLGVSIGGSFLGGSVSGEYDKLVLENTDTNKISQSASIRMGQICLAEEPALSKDARDVLSKGGFLAFQSAYGDYYVAGFSLGADSGICLSFSENDRSESESLRITVTVKFLFMSASHTWSDSSASALQNISMELNGYDTLTGSNIKTSTHGPNGLQSLRQDAAQITARDTSIAARDVASRLQSLGVKDKGLLGMRDMPQLQASQLVVEVLLLPWTGISEVASFLPSDWHI
ncbi:hypothetical protein LTR15_003596 [Elasticomyces elasticus]|nr:hypothetical protein LTR15_003596 [Elasticomyces elasticus]